MVLTHTRLGVVVLVAVLAGGAQAQDAEQLHARSLSSTCANCHGSDGKPPAGSALVPLAGMPAPYFLARMKAFKDNGQPTATVMHQIAQGFNDAQIQQMAEHFASLKR